MTCKFCLLLLFTMLLQIIACSSPKQRSRYFTDSKYNFKLNHEWEMSKDKKMDYLFTHKDGMQAYSKSFCSSNLPDKLDKISFDLLRKFKYQEIIEQEEVVFKKNNTIYKLLRAQINDQSIFLYHLVLLTSKCFYDINAISLNEDEKDTFINLIKGIKL